MGKTERVQFTGVSGGEIAGRLELPTGPVRARALFAHCFTCSKDLKAVVRISRALADRGIAVLRFDFTGLGESDGDFSETDFTSNVDDLSLAAEFMRSGPGGPQLLVGHSLGGLAVLAAARRIPEVRAVVTLGAPSDTAHLRDTLLEAGPELATADSAVVTLGGRAVRVGRELVEDLDEHNLEAQIESLGKPLLILHSPVDETVSIDHAASIYKAARHPKSFVSLDGADHLLLARDEDSRFAADIIASWSARYLGDKSVAPQRPAVEDGEVAVNNRGSGFTQSVVTPAHHWLADEPAAAGGADLGPSPYELLLAALGACKSMTLKMYAVRKGWALEGVGVKLRHSRTHAQDCAACEAENGLISRIDVELDIDGQLDATQRQRLLEIADRCPVHRTLTTQTHIETQLTERSV